MRKYLDDIGVTSRPDNYWNGVLDKESLLYFEKEREIYGFDSRETYSLDSMFCMWMYEHLMMYKEKAQEVVDLNYSKFNWKGESYTQLQLIDLMIERFRFYLSSEYDDCNEDHVKAVTEAIEIWAVVFPAMWW